MSASPTKQATVEDVTSASPTPTPPPTSDLPESSSTQVDKVEDQPIDSLGDDDEEEEEWDPSSERLPGQSSLTSKNKGKAVEDGNDKEEEGKEKEQDQPWQAVWASEQNAWYFWNKDTGEVTWTNPLEPSSSSSSTQPPLPTEQPPTAAASSSSSTNPGPNDNDNGYGFDFGSGDPSQPEIDPGLAHLFGGDSTGPGGDPTMQKAMFNSRTGRFTASNYEYTVGHLDEYNRAKRMNSHYFDVDQWEREKQQENEKKRKALEDGKGGEKKITKKDMERFRKKNAEKKARSQAWLRE